MELFNKDLVDKALEQTYAFIQLKFEAQVLTLTLDRAEKKNAIHPHMVQEIAFALQFAKQTNAVRAVVINALGDVFCSGADLKAFMGMVGNFESSIPKSDQEILLGELFNQVHKPVISKIEGDVFAGGLFFLAGPTYVVCTEDVKIGLPEVKRGLFPFQVMASLLDVMPKRKVIDWCINGDTIDANKAFEYGLVTHLTSKETIDDTVNSIINKLLENSPTAIRLGLEAADYINKTKSEHAYLMQMLQKTIMSKDAQEGMLAFKEKRKPNWSDQ
ncbi:MAG TPA: enoyl-CoA hydratase-related protein [Xanthomarina sp.]|nr:enoyl-CoA hydratase-related protein [Xanthomarina sp.]